MATAILTALPDNTSAQKSDSSQVLIKPLSGFGHFAWRDTLQNVEYWQVNLVERTYSNDSTYSDAVHNVSPGTIPNGMLLNKFTFQDGSSKTVTTFKQ